MADPMNTTSGSGPQPTAVTYKNPRRTSPENSITLRHHRLAREASRRNSPVLNTQNTKTTSSPRRNDSDESNETGETGLSDPKSWFDKSNANPDGVFDPTSMEVDPPFYQKETDSSNEEGGPKFVPPMQSPSFRVGHGRSTGLLRPSLTHSSSADDYRSVIDDLTIENKRLREELKRYRQMGPDSLRREKLFEVKIHGLPSRKRRELEATLRDFTTSLDSSSADASPKRKKDKSQGKGVKSSLSKHASSSSGSHSRPNQPTDSAYASMSTGPSSSNLSLPSKRMRQNSDQAVEQYLQDIPEGLWPKRVVLSESDKKRLVVKRLEQIFTGKGMGQPGQSPAAPGEAALSAPAQSLAPPAIAGEDVEMTTPDDKNAPTETIREAHILSRSRGKESHSRDNESSNSNGDQTDPRDNGNGSGSGSGHGSGSGGRNNTSPPDPSLPQQRPTRPRDLDPDRAQNSSENMDYLRHLGLTAPKAVHFSSRDVSPDAEGWVYLNLLCNLAQLHMFNVTPDFIRTAVSEKSTQFQLSPDGRKIRWRGGLEGTKFNSDSSGNNSQRENSDTDGSNEQDQRKKQKTQVSGNDVIISEPSKFGPQVSSSSDSFHYKPLFVHQQTSSSDEQPSLGDETGSSYGAAEDSNLGMTSKWNQSGVSGLSQRKRRRDGAIIYYTGAPFCTDLSGDFGEASLSSDNIKSEPAGLEMTGPKFVRTSSGSSIPFKPLSSLVSHHAMMDLDFTPPELITDESDISDDIDADFSWSDGDSVQPAILTNFEASGLAGIYPEDNFVVMVSTRRPKSCGRRTVPIRPTLVKGASHDSVVSADTADSVASRLAAMTTGSPLFLHLSGTKQTPTVEIDYVTGRIRRLPPAPLPPASYFFSAATDTDSEDSDSWSETGISRRRSERRSIHKGLVPMSGNEELSSGDEEDEEDDDVAFDDSGNSSPDKVGEITDNVGDMGIGRRASGRVSDLSKLTRGSSAATAGGAPSGYSSMGDV